jgi:ribonuclease P/MRP protein subunit RPP40
LENIPDMRSMVNSRGILVTDIVFNEEKIYATLQKLQDNKAAGVDEMNSTFIKKSIEGMVKPLVKIFNESMSTGAVPMDWKTANITALFKKGAKSDANNYRPVSLTSQIGKIMERVIKKELVSFLEENNLLFDSQHGFRRNRSCLTNLLEFMQGIANSLDKGNPTDVIYLDFQKAFDKVPHRRLLYKLKDIGIEGRLLAWIEDWLSNRRQRVVLNGRCSIWEDVTSGVPQGSVLGPVLFIIFINDLDERILNKLLKFADDTKLIGEVNCMEKRDELQQDLDKLIDWSILWQMSFNIEKCKVMHLGHGNKEYKYLMNGKELQTVMEERDLGVIISQNLKVSQQCGIAARKGYQLLGLISRSFSCKKKSIIIKLYKSLVRPHLDYCVQAWRPHLQKDIDVLERVQRRATRMIDECKGMDYEERLRITGLTTLETRRLRADLVEVYKILNGIDKVDESKFFERYAVGASARGTCITRGNSLKLFQSRARLDIAKYSFGNRVVQHWNHLPNEVVQGCSVDAFKGKLDKYLVHTGGFI